MSSIRKKNFGLFYLIAFLFMLPYNSADDPIQCVQCTGDSCTATVSACANENVTATQCFTKIDSSGVISRGCLVDATTCKAEENCIATGAGQNNQVICKTCDATDDNCSQTDVSDNKYNKICNSGITKCLVKVDNKLVVRACASDTETCNDTNTCKLCTGDKCNAGIFPEKRLQCYQCNGDKCNDVSANSIANKPCINFDDKDECYTKGDNDTAMFRGCKSDANTNQCSSAAPGCVYCSTNGCNNLKYKHDQTLKCYQCTGDNVDSDCFKQQTSNDFKTCTEQILYTDSEYCYAAVSDETIIRGCLHDNKDLTVDLCTNNDTDSCTKCNTANGCNSAKKDPQEFTCIVCRSDLDKECWNDADKLTGKNCRTGTSSSKDGCFHGIWHGVAIRGCVIDASIQVQELCRDKNSNQCHICNSKNCNTAKTSGTGKMTLNLGILLIVLTIWWNFK